MEIHARIQFDMTLVSEQAAALRAALVVRGLQTLEGFASDLDGLLSDLVLGEGMPTAGADGTVEIVYRPRLGAKFDLALAAIRAGKRND